MLKFKGNMDMSSGYPARNEEERWVYEITAGMDDITLEDCVITSGTAVRDYIDIVIEIGNNCLLLNMVWEAVRVMKKEFPESAKNLV